MRDYDDFTCDLCNGKCVFVPSEEEMKKEVSYILSITKKEHVARRFLLRDLLRDYKKKGEVKCFRCGGDGYLDDPVEKQIEED